MNASSIGPVEEQVHHDQGHGERPRLARDRASVGADRLDRLLAQVRAVEVVRQPGQRARRHRVRGGRGAVVPFAVADDERLVVARGGEEAARLVGEVGAHPLRQRFRLAQVTGPGPPASCRSTSASARYA